MQCTLCIILPVKEVLYESVYKMNGEPILLKIWFDGIFLFLNKCVILSIFIDRSVSQVVVVNEFIQITLEALGKLMPLVIIIVVQYLDRFAC